jgi:ParB family chromosome partitioning protein
MPKPKALGRGLSALFNEAEAVYDQADAAADRTAVAKAPIEWLRPGKFQPRRNFDEEAIERLAGSIRSHGIIQPIVVRADPASSAKAGSPRYEIVAGERRWRAAQRAGLHEVPIVVQDLADRDALEIALVENLQRQDLDPVEEAEGFRRLMDEFGHTQERLAEILGKSRSHVANMLRLLGLPDPVKRMVQKGELSAGHARALIGAADPVALARDVMRRGLNVRQTEKLATAAAAPKSGPKPPAASDEKDPDVAALEQSLTAQLGVRVTIESAGRSGRLILGFSSLDQLDDLLHRLTKKGG